MKRFLIIFLSVLTLMPVYSQKKKTTTTKRTKTTVVDKKTQLKNQASAAQAKRKQSQERARQLQRSVKESLDSVLILDNNIGKQRVIVDSLQKEIRSLNSQVTKLNRELKQLQKELEDRKSKYANSLVRLRRHRTVQQKLAFIFSADNFEQVFRRMRYLQEYSTYQQAQGKMLAEKQLEVKTKQHEILQMKSKVQKRLSSVEKHKKELESMRKRSKDKINYLNKNLSTVNKQISDLQKQEKALNDQIDRIIQEEIEAARKKAEAERKEKERKLAEAKAAKEKALAEQKKAKSSAEKKAAQKKVEEAEKSVKEAQKRVGEKIDVWESDASDLKLSSNFASNKGRLPMPITGKYSIVGHYGRYTVQGLRNVQLDNKGIDIRGQQGAKARSVFNGEVSSVFQYGGRYIIMVRHGSYISVYSGLTHVSVKKNQKVSTGQALGTVGKNSDGQIELHFQLRKESTRLNPEIWLK